MKKAASDNPAGANRPAPSLEARLVAAARARLEKEGLEAATLRAAARDVGVSHMAPYRHFKDKDALLAAVAEQGFRDLTRSMNAGDGRIGVGVAYVAFAMENPALYRLMFSASLVPRDRYPGLVAAGAAAFDKCLAAAGAKIDAAGAAPVEPPTSAVAIWALVHGLANLALDGLIPLPAAEPARGRRIAEILKELA
jgi:AcrR family transcriptional regulator